MSTAFARRRPGCRKAVKLLTEYERLCGTMGMKIPRGKLRLLDEKREAAEITSHDLPGALQREFPGQFASLTLKEIRTACSEGRQQT